MLPATSIAFCGKPGGETRNGGGLITCGASSGTFSALTELEKPSRHRRTFLASRCPTTSFSVREASKVLLIYRPQNNTIYRPLKKSLCVLSGVCVTPWGKHAAYLIIYRPLFTGSPFLFFISRWFPQVSQFTHERMSPCVLNEQTSLFSILPSISSVTFIIMSVPSFALKESPLMHSLNSG